MHIIFKRCKGPYIMTTLKPVALWAGWTASVTPRTVGDSWRSLLTVAGVVSDDRKLSAVSWRCSFRSAIRLPAKAVRFLLDQKRSCKIYS